MIEWKLDARLGRDFDEWNNEQRKITSLNKLQRDFAKKIECKRMHLYRQVQLKFNLLLKLLKR